MRFTLRDHTPTRATAVLDAFEPSTRLRQNNTYTNITYILLINYTLNYNIATRKRTTDAGNEYNG